MSLNCSGRCWTNPDPSYPGTAPDPPSLFCSGTQTRRRSANTNSLSSEPAYLVCRKHLTGCTTSTLRCLSWQLHGMARLHNRTAANDASWTAHEGSTILRNLDCVYKSTLYSVPKDSNFKPDIELYIHEILCLQQCRVFIHRLFRKLRQANVGFVMLVCTSVLPSALNNSAPAGRISMKFVIVYFSKISEKPSFITIWQEWRALYMQTDIHF